MAKNTTIRIMPTMNFPDIIEQVSSPNLVAISDIDAPNISDEQNLFASYKVAFVFGVNS